MRFARRAYGSLPSEYDTFNAPLATASPPRGIPSANPTISGATTPTVFRSACHALIFDRSTCLTICHNAFTGLGFWCSIVAALPAVVVVDGGDESIVEFTLPPAPPTEIFLGGAPARTTNLAHVPRRVETSGPRVFFRRTAYQSSDSLHLK